MRIHVFAACLIALSLCSAAIAAPVFLPRETRQPVIREGQGGDRRTVDGVDFWSSGDPPKRYQVLGTMTNERHKTGLWGLIRMSSLDSDIAKATKDAGGDAVIVLNERDEITGVVGSSFANANGNYGNGSVDGNAFSFGSSSAVKDHVSRLLVVRYLPDLPAPDTTPAPQPTSPPAQ